MNDKFISEEEENSQKSEFSNWIIFRLCEKEWLADNKNIKKVINHNRYFVCYLGGKK